MKHIKKSEEPETFRDWKAKENENWQPNWGNFQKPEKTIVHESLLQEQGFICCYCGMRITRKTSHIEHLKPRHLYPDRILNYDNFLASCQGESTDPPPKPIHCGHQKDYSETEKDWYERDLMVSPLDPNCEQFFKYLGSGEILPTDDRDRQLAAKTTIEQLGLDIAKLRTLRKSAIDGLILAIDGLPEEEIVKFSHAYTNLNDNGEYEPFCTAIAYILKQYFSVSCRLG